MQAILSSDLVLVIFSLLLGGLVGAYWERARSARQAQPAADEGKRLERP